MAFGRNEEGNRNKSSLVLRYKTGPDGIVPKETIYFSSNILASSAYSILQVAVKQNIAMPNNAGVFHVKRPPSAESAPSAKIFMEDSHAGLRRFLG